MYIANLGEIKAVAFDIDGTLYKSFQLNVRIIFHFLRWNQFLLNYGIVRSKLHRVEKFEDFALAQATMLSKRIGCSVEVAQERLDRIVYSGLSKFFKYVPACKYVCETIKDFHNAGLKIAMMSDFPPEQKGELWGLLKYCDVVLGSESTGALKPSSHPFYVLAEKLDVAPENILYVGNSIKYDVIGAKSAGMKAAHFEPFWRTLFNIHCKKADIVFSDYRKLKNIVLEQKV